MTRIKVCGVASPEEALACASVGVDSVGVNFVRSSPRRIDADTARAVVQAVGAQMLVVGIVAGMTVPAMRALKTETGVGCLQLHGDETAEEVSALLPHAYKAVRIETRDDVVRAATMPGDYVLVDAKVGIALGGTGHVFDWSLVVELARTRRVVLAGGLTPQNVGKAIEIVRPWCVDVASGVETAAHKKDLEKVRAFVGAVRRADATTAPI